MLSQPRISYKDPDGIPYPGALVSFYESGSSTPVVVYQDALYQTPHTVPVTQLGDGYFPAIYLQDDGGDIKAVFTDSAGGNSKTVDPVNSVLESDRIAALLYPTTEDEVAASVTPTIYIPSLRIDLERYGGSPDATALVNNAALSKARSVLISKGGGELVINEGQWDFSAAIDIFTGMHLLGRGQGSTILRNVGTTDSLTSGNGTDQILNASIRHIKVLGSGSSGRGFYGRIFSDGCYLDDAFFEFGSKGIVLDSCYSSGLTNVRVRSAVGNNIELNAITHNTRLIGVKSQVSGGHGIYITGCYTPTLYGCNFEYNQLDQIHIATGRGISIRDCYVEGIQPTASGYAGVHIVTADGVLIEGGLFDATQSPAMGTDATGTYVKVSGAASRVEFRDYGYPTTFTGQTHVNFGASADNCRAVVPLGSTYTNLAASCRVLNGVHDERGVIAYHSASQSFTDASWTGVQFGTEVYDSKTEWDTSTHRFAPKDYGVYQVNAFVGVDLLAADAYYYVRLYNVTDSTEIAQARFGWNNTASSFPVAQVAFTEFLSHGKEYQIQIFLDDSTDRNNIAGTATQRLSIRRVG